MKRSVLGYALTCTPTIPATLVHRAHYTSQALFGQPGQIGVYEAIDSKGKVKKVQLTKERFVEALRLPIYNSKEMVVRSADQLVTMFNEMGYEPLLERISTFKKNQLPDLWGYFFSIILRCLSGRTSGLDSASVAFQGLLFGIYYDVKVDFTSVLWADFCSHINHSLKGTKISNARFWAIVVHAHYQQIGYIADPSLTEMRFTPIAIPAIDEKPGMFCAQIPEVMLSKVPTDCIEVNNYCKTLTIPYPTRDLSQAAPVKEQPKGKGKTKVTGGPSGPKREEKKRRTSGKSTPKRKQPKRPRKLAIVDESSDSERTPSTVHEEELEEEQFDDQPPSPPPTTKPLTPPYTTVPPSPPKTTAPLPPPPTTAQETTTIHTSSSEVPPPPPPTSAQQKTTIHTTTSDIPPPPPPTTAPRTTTIPISGIDLSLPDFDLSQAKTRQNPSSAAYFEAFHMAPIVAEGPSDEELPEEAFVLMKQYKVLNSNLDTLIQAQTGFDPTQPTLETSPKRWNLWSSLYQRK
ncbi:hypothetical protein L1887_28167 [Cichorium endivia]|nr:hypothetical protein L1887_28167 [Cichorium endivia]